MRFRVPSLRFVICLCLALGLPVVARAQELPTGTITGTVLVTGTDAPLEGAQITVLTTERRALTDARGRFFLTGIAPGIWRLQVRAIVTYLDIQNLTGRENVSGLQWDQRTQAVEQNPSLGLLPSIGFIIDF